MEQPPCALWAVRAEQRRAGRGRGDKREGGPGGGGGGGRLEPMKARGAEGLGARPHYPQPCLAASTPPLPRDPPHSTQAAEAVVVASPGHGSKPTHPSVMQASVTAIPNPSPALEPLNPTYGPLCHSHLDSSEPLVAFAEPSTLT